MNILKYDIDYSFLLILDLKHLLSPITLSQKKINEWDWAFTQILVEFGLR